MRKTMPIHALLFSQYPILFLFSRNIDKLEFTQIIRASLMSFLVSVLLLAGLRFVVKSIHRRGIIVSFFLLSFYSYGHVAIFFPNVELKSVQGLSIYRDDYLLFLWSFLLIAIVVWMRKSSRRFANANILLNAAAVFLVLISVVQILIYTIRAGPRERLFFSSSKPLINEETKVLDNNSASLPDIYYIVLDGHARSDILEEIYHHDNSEFINELKGAGFYIASKSVTNYLQTYQSISSTLNMEYINYLSNDVSGDYSQRGLYRDLLNNNKVSKNLKDIGYFLITYESGWAGTESIHRTDMVLKEGLGLSEFESILIGTTPLAVLGGEHIQFEVHRKRILFTLGSMPDITDIQQPTFTYAHIYAPHPPFVFDRSGQNVVQKVSFGTNDPSWKYLYNRSSNDYIRAYKDQLIFIDKKIIEVIKEILHRSKEEPIIILQSDHGPAALFHYDGPDDIALRERASIFNAYYFPGNNHDSLYESITPVNTYRLIFNMYFGENYEMLEDNSYYSTWDRPYEFELINEKVN